MHLKEQKVSNGSESNDSQLEGKSMAPPKFSLQASADDRPGNNLGGKLGDSEMHGDGLLIGSLDNAIEGAKSGAQIGYDFGSGFGELAGVIGGGIGGLLGGISGALTPDPPKLEHATVAKAADGSGNDRTKVGVGESVIFRFPNDGIWEATSGTPVTQGTGKVFVWTAPDRAGTSTISIKSGDISDSVSIEVVEPQSVIPKKASEISYPAGTMGAGMHLYFDYHPMSVSFSNVEAGEKSGPASNITGYFTQFGADALKHDSGDTFWSIGAKNRLSAQDSAYGYDLPQPYSDGGLQWLIPNRFRVATEGGEGKVFDHMIQTFKIEADGTFTVTKGAESVTRKP